MIMPAPAVAHVRLPRPCSVRSSKCILRARQSKVHYSTTSSSPLPSQLLPSVLASVSEYDNDPIGFKSFGATPNKAIDMDGKALAKKKIERIKAETNALKLETGIQPQLAVIMVRAPKYWCQLSRSPHFHGPQVGDRKDSEAYVNKKIKACQDAGFLSKSIRFGGNTTQEQVISVRLIDLK
jgi:hypothetical protein